MAKVIKNISGITKVWGGTQIDNLQSYTCQSQGQAVAFGNDDNFVNDLANGNAEVYSDSLKINGSGASINFLMDNLRDANGALIVRSKAFFDAEGFRFRGVSFQGTAIAESVTAIDYEVSQERYVNGGLLIVSQIGDGDSVSIQVVDKNNIMGFGNDIVLDQFITDFFISQNGDLQIILAYPARVYGGLFFRLLYNNTSTTNTLIKCNLFLHWKAS